MNTNESDPNADFKLAICLNKRVETGKVMNALAHAVAGLINQVGTEGRMALKFLDFHDADGGCYPSISARSFIVLRGGESDLRKARQQAMDAGVPVVAFIQSMTGDTFIEQLTRTEQTASAAISFYAVALVGSAAKINPITKRFSLWRDAAAPTEPPASAVEGIGADQAAFGGRLA